jgi:hypothetical protein
VYSEAAAAELASSIDGPAEDVGSLACIVRRRLIKGSTKRAVGTGPWMPRSLGYNLRPMESGGPFMLPLK